MNKLEIIKSIEELKIDKEYGDALKQGIQNIDEDNAIEIATEMAYEMLPVYEEAFPENKAPREALDLAVEYRKNPTELNKENLENAAAAAFAASNAAWAADVAAWAASSAAAWAASSVTSAAYNAANAALRAYDDAGYEQFCCKYLDKILEIIKKKEKE